ncbi:conserved protein of unknown function [Thermococcus nautili]|uniref:hypothetical protein n=1 Tax=Thermococcus nautili TaxID=195522 RepID=UPI002556E7EF|nr:hypothetical protein [Thermococcus nautili]CAI1491916.1 conserved protein of unknown function [Thermococcus nautili]
MSEVVNPEVYTVERLLEDREKRVLIFEIVLKLASSLGVTVEELLKYLEWKENLEKLEKAEKEKAVGGLEVEEPTEDAPEDLSELLIEVKEDVRKWLEIERKLRAMGLEL